MVDPGFAREGVDHDEYRVRAYIGVGGAPCGVKRLL